MDTLHENSQAFLSEFWLTPYVFIEAEYVSNKSNRDK
jgi:hypothetical protein